MGNLDVVHLALLHQLLLAFQDSFQEVLVDGRLLREIILEAIEGSAIW